MRSANAVLRCVPYCCLLYLAAVATPALAQSGAPAPSGLVVLHTDYGADSIYVGAIKGAIYSKFPNARIDSISNSIPSFDIQAGADLLAEVNREFPKGTTFCCIVDPGVGTSRKGIALLTNLGQYFVGPDNGIMQGVAERDGIAALHEIANAALWREGAQSTTFHGRDIFGPVAAAVASGTSLETVGPKIEGLTTLEAPQIRIENGKISGQVSRTDDYGNVVSNIRRERLEEIGAKMGDTVHAQIGGHSFVGPLSKTYSDVPPGKALAVFQSSGYLEFALNKGSLATAIGAKYHDAIEVWFEPAGAPQLAPEEGAQPPQNENKELDVAIEFEQSGGFAGVIESLRIEPDGSAHFESRRAEVDIKLHPATLAKIQDALEGLDFDALNKQPEGPVLGGADYMNYVIKVGDKKVETNSLRAPQELYPLLQVLSGVAQDARKNAPPK